MQLRYFLNDTKKQKITDVEDVGSKVTKLNSNNATKEKNDDETKETSIRKQDNVKYVDSLKDVIESILSQCVIPSKLKDENTTNLFQQLQDLYNDAMNDLLQVSTTETQHQQQNIDSTY